MIMTVGKLKEQLNGVSEDTALYVLVDGAVTPLVSITIAEKGSLAFMRGKGKGHRSRSYTSTEDGLIGGLNAMGISDARIAELLDRTERSVKQRMKRIGLC